MGRDVSYKYQHIEDIDRRRKAYIMYKDKAIGEIWHEYCSLSEEFDWVIKVYWDVWDKFCESGDILDIAGINTDVRWEEYVRRYNPEFVTQRIPPKGRADVPELLKNINLLHYDEFEILCRTHGKCGNDDLYVSREKDKIIDINRVGFDYDIPDFDTKQYGWIDKNSCEKA